MKQLRQNLSRFKKSGNLYKSFTATIKNNALIISSNSPYANIQNTGGRIRITERMRKAMWALFYDTGSSVYKAIALTKKAYITLRGKNYLNINIASIFDSIIKKIHNKNV